VDKVTDWKVRIYKRNQVVASWVIKDRTERQAESEAMSDIPRECTDYSDDHTWTMMDMKSEAGQNYKVSWVQHHYGTSIIVADSFDKAWEKARDEEGLGPNNLAEDIDEYKGWEVLGLTEVDDEGE
jgi:hypothetical protein